MCGQDQSGDAPDDVVEGVGKGVGVAVRHPVAHSQLELVDQRRPGGGADAQRAGTEEDEGHMALTELSDFTSRFSRGA